MKFLLKPLSEIAPGKKTSGDREDGKKWRRFYDTDIYVIMEKNLEAGEIWELL